MDELEHGPAYDAAREPELEDPVKPYREAGKRNRKTADTAAEHDDLLAEVLFELTMQELEG